jgi:hypothetical protein
MPAFSKPLAQLAVLSAVLHALVEAVGRDEIAAFQPEALCPFQLGRVGVVASAAGPSVGPAASLASACGSVRPPRRNQLGSKARPVVTSSRVMA